MSLNTNSIVLEKYERHVVLVSPEIHWNTGNIGRTCLATGTFLHVVKPISFSLDSRELKRAGLDYWKDVKLKVWDNFDIFLEEMKPLDGEIMLLSKRGATPFWAMPCLERLFLVFGSETQGLPPSILKRYPATTYHIPITAGTRSLNLSTAAGIVLYDTLRYTKPFHAWAT